jgi:hypothetical protein
MRIVIEVEGAEINIIARAVAGQGQVQDTSLSQAAGNIADAGAAPQPDMGGGVGSGDNKADMGNVTRTSAQDAGGAPELPGMGPAGATGATEPHGQGDAQVVNAGAAKFTPPGNEDAEQTHG